MKPPCMAKRPRLSFLPVRCNHKLRRDSCFHKVNGYGRTTPEIILCMEGIFLRKFLIGCYCSNAVHHWNNEGHRVDDDGKDTHGVEQPDGQILSGVAFSY